MPHVLINPSPHVIVSGSSHGLYCKGKLPHIDHTGIVLTADEQYRKIRAERNGEEFFVSSFTVTQVFHETVPAADILSFCLKTAAETYRQLNLWLSDGRVMEILNTIPDGVRRIAAWRCLDLPDSVFGRLMELETIV